MDEGYLGLDVGTQGLKAVGIRPDGKVLWQTAISYETAVPHPGWAEQSPADWDGAVVDVLEWAAQEPIRWKGIGLTGQMHTTVATDEVGTPLRPAILWSDQRTGIYVERLKREYGVNELMKITGNAPLTNFSALRLLWMRDEEPNLYRRIRHVAVTKDWVRWRLTGKWGSEVTDASGTYLLDVANRAWAQQWMETLEFPEEWFGALTESHDLVGELQVGPDSLRGLPVVAGAGDQAASAIGSGLKMGDLGISLGTSGVLFWPLPQYVPAPQATVHAFCHAQPEEWHWMTVTQAAALSLRWFRDTLFPQADYATVDQITEAVEPGSGGLTFWPYLNGERAPIGLSKAVGGFYGITVATGLPAMARAVLEGVAFSLKHCYDVMNSRGDIVPKSLVMTGGGSQSRVWTRIFAHVFAQEIIVVDDRGAAVGAAWLARNGIEGGETPYPRTELVVVHPEEAHVQSYRDGYGRYLEVVNHLMEAWDE